MLDRTGNFPALSRTHVATALGVLSVSVMTASAGWPQAAAPPSSFGVTAPTQQAVPDRPQSQPPVPQQNEAPPSSPPENPGLINEIGKLWEKSKSILPALRSPQEAIEDLNARGTDATKDAGASLSRMAKPPLMVSGRMGCPVSANGAPDCKAGADRLCQSKGYQEGKSLDTDAAEKCSAKVYLPGRKREPGDCRTENYVTRALCQ
ncbi:hypothetical protein [Bradyrhizobium sp.]|uniref:hypothetical protein n=1 Tax=Bradyrhizobium sp. TaxID=376 RepID=UPI0025C37621|nr:hypothetical protein [Bradyrhizobium sp.]